MTSFDFMLILFCIVAETGSVLCFKRGVDEDESNPAQKSMVAMVLTTPLLWLGIALWAIELVAWISVLEHTPLSVAFPVMSLVYCAVPIASHWVLREELPKRQWLASGMIALGVALIGSTGA